MHFRDKTSADGESGDLKKSKQKQKRENAWRTKGPRDPFSMVSVIIVVIWKQVFFTLTSAITVLKK